MVLTIKPEQVSTAIGPSLRGHKLFQCAYDAPHISTSGRHGLQGMWKGGIFQFSINTPPMYPHDPPKVGLHLIDLCLPPA